MITKKEANENATIRHGEMIHVEPAQDITWIPKDSLNLPELPKCQPSTTEELAKKSPQFFHGKKILSPLN